ncbi:MAG: adenosine kinase [Armatimonadota bacterium]
MFDVYCLCNPLFDILATTSDEILTECGSEKGAMTLVSVEHQRRLLSQAAIEINAREAGGSGANTAIGVAQLGYKAAFGGCVGRDDFGLALSDALLAGGVTPHFGQTDVDTGVCLVLTTPDAQRTMHTCLGASQYFSPELVNVDAISNSNILYVTGYLWDTKLQQDAVEHAMTAARNAGRLVAFSLSDAFCVERHREAFENLLSSHVDIVFGNEHEALAISGKDDVHEAGQWLAQVTGHLAIITRGPDGCLFADANGTTSVPAVTTDAVDTTGAGDMFASAALCGLVAGYTYEQTGRLASFMAASIVAQYGPRNPQIDIKAALTYAGVQVP